MDLVSLDVGINVLCSKPSEHAKEVEMSSIPVTSQPDRDPTATVLLPKNLDPVRPSEDDPAESTTQVAPLPTTFQCVPDPIQAIGPSENDPAECTTQVAPLPKTFQCAPDPIPAIGPSENDPAECTPRLTSLPETVQSAPDPKQAIGPYLTSAGIDKTSFSPGLTELPRIAELKNGLVLELYYYFTNTLKKSQKEFARNLIIIGGHTEVKLMNVCGYLCKVVKKHKDIKRKMKGAQLRYALDQLLNKEFRFIRSVKTNEPRKRILMEDLSSLRMKTRGLKRKLENSEAQVAAHQNEALEEQHHEEIQDKQVSDKLALIDAVDRQGGFWKTPEIIEREYVKLQDKDENTIKHAIYDQLQFVRKVLQVTGREKEFFQLSKMSDGIRVDFTKEEMKARLIEIVLWLYEPRTRVNDNRSSTSSKAHSDTAKPVESEEEECYIKKRKIFEEILASRMERAIQSKQQHLDSLLQNPSLLIGRTINLAFRNERETLPNWCKGVVIGMAREDEKPLLTEFCVDFTQFEDQNRMEWVFILRLIEDLKNNDLIIHTS